MIDKLASGSKLVAALAGAWAFSLPALAQGIVTPGAQAFDKAATSKTHDMMPFANPSGYAATFSTTGFIDRDNPFFQNLGTNGRTCGTCHVSQFRADAVKDCHEH